MAKVLGVGGVFFKSANPQDLCEWYSKWLNIEIDKGTNSSSFKIKSMPQDAFNVWASFKKDTKYFDPSKKDFMINLIVDNLNEALQQVKEGGAELVGEVEEYEFGNFGWFIDPDGNKIELWEP